MMIFFAVCRVDTDVVFVVDSSGSIRSGNYQLVRNYLYAYTEGLLSSDSSSRVGVILFSSSAQVAIGLDFVTTSGQLALLGQIATLRYIGEGTNTPEGLCLLKTMSWRESASVLRVAVVLTDGKSTGSSSTCWQSGGTLSSTAAEVHSLQPPVTVFAVGVGNYNPAELNIIASSPLLVDELNSFDAQLLLQNQRSRTDSICFKGKLKYKNIKRVKILSPNRNSASFNWTRAERGSPDGLSLAAPFHWFRR